jgi:hypothetical protein
MMARARYETVDEESTSEVLVIRDVGGSRAMTVTNDAESVVAELHQHYGLGARKLLYYDSSGDLDELVHDGAGRFVGFAPGPRGGGR